MYESKFSRWARWSNRDELLGIKFPGIYVIAITPLNIEGRPFSWRKEIAYVGMTVAVSGLIGRLRSFDYTISGKRLAHGGADRVRYEHPDYSKLVNRLYVAVASVRCNPATNTPVDLARMGEVVRLEYLSLAEFVKAHHKLPQFNNKNSAPKFSRL